MQLVSTMLSYSLAALFAQKGFHKSNDIRAKQEFHDALSIPNLPKRMRNTARSLYVPNNLAFQIDVPIFLVWGKYDRWYPPIVARAISRATNAPTFWIDGGHYCMWESPAQFDRALKQIEEQLS